MTTRLVNRLLTISDSLPIRMLEERPAVFSEPQDLGEVSFDELKSLWQKAIEGYDLYIPFLKRQDPNLTLSEAQGLVPEGDKAAFEKAFDAVDQFLPLLENVLIRNKAENILKNAFISTPADFSLRTSRIDKAIKELKAKYDK